MMTHMTWHDRCVIFTCFVLFFLPKELYLWINIRVLCQVLFCYSQIQQKAIRPLETTFADDEGSGVFRQTDTGVSSQCGASSSCVSARLEFNFVASDH